MRLKELRQKANKSQKEMANLLNMSQTGYSSYEIGRTDPDIETLKKIAQYFHVTIDYLVENETPYLIDKSQFTDIQLEIIEKLKNLSKEVCERINAYIEGALFAEKEKIKIINLYKGRNNYDDE